jgi:hypothetical protein
MCILYRHGAVYACGSSGATGGSYGDQFNNGGGNPNGDVLGAGSDGGYAQDNRHVSDKISEVSSNIEARIADVSRRSDEVRTALPNWVDSNNAYLSQRQGESAAGSAAASQSRSSFSTAHAAEIATAKAQIDAFVAQPLDPSHTAQLVNQIGGTVLSLPDVPADAVVPELPSVTGISARDRAYPGMTADPVGMAIARERLKMAVLPLGSVARVEADRALNAANAFKANAPALSNALLRDAAAIRFLGSGKRATAELTTVLDDGSISTAVVNDLTKLPPDTLLARSDHFGEEMSTFQIRKSSLQAAIDDGRADAVQIRSVLSADDVRQRAQGLFFSGDVIDGEKAMKAALLILDVATSLTPFVSEGRDIYEAVTGKNLITGEDLDNVARTAAVIGAISGGLGDKPLAALRCIKKLTSLGETAEEAEKIVVAASKMDSLTVHFADHVLEEAASDPLRPIERHLIDDTLDFGERWWDVDKRSILSIETDAQHAERVVTTYKHDQNIVTTVYWESRTDEEMAKVLTADKKGLRFHKMKLED